MRSLDSVVPLYDCWFRTEYETENDEERPINPNARAIIAIGTTYTGIAFVTDVAMASVFVDLKLGCTTPPVSVTYPPLYLHLLYVYIASFSS
jgi:hypothetical protein